MSSQKAFTGCILTFPGNYSFSYPAQLSRHTKRHRAALLCLNCRTNPATEVVYMAFPGHPVITDGIALVSLLPAWEKGINRKQRARNCKGDYRNTHSQLLYVYLPFSTTRRESSSFIWYLLKWRHIVSIEPSSSNRMCWGIPFLWKSHFNEGNPNARI